MQKKYYMSIMKITRLFMWSACALLALDFAGFVMWMMSGQVPQGEFYVGVITTKVLAALILR